MAIKNFKIYTLMFVLFAMITSYFYFQTHQKIASKKEYINRLETIYHLHNISTDLKIYRGLQQLDYSQTRDKKLRFLFNSLNNEIKRIENRSISQKIEKNLSQEVNDKKKSFSAFSSTIADIYNEILNVAKEGKLFQNDKYIINTLVYDIPSLTENIGRLRGKGASVLASKKILLEDEYNFKSYLSDFNKKMKQLKQNTKKLEDKKEFLQLEKKIENKMKIFSISIKQVIKNDFIPINKYFNEGTDVIYALNEYNDLLYEVIKTKLKSDIKKENKKLESLLLFLSLIVFLLSLYLLYINRKKIIK